MTDPIHQFDVIIIGYGPVGATAALLLRQRGLSVAVIDRLTEPFPLPRAAILDGEVARLLQNLGIKDAMGEDLQQLRGGGFRTAELQPIGPDLVYPEGALGSQGHFDSHSFHQPTFERVLRNRAVAQGVCTYLGYEAALPVQDADAVSVAATPSAGDEPVILSGRWLIAADGAASPVREGLGIDWGSLGYDRDWLVLDLILTDPALQLPEIGLQVCDPDRIHTYVPMAAKRRRWEIIFNPGDTREEMLDPARQWQLLSRYLTPDQAVIERAAAYQFHSAIATQWQAGRIFLAGDAAHQTAPFLGQGLCTGLRDVANLAWKFDFVKRGLLPESALASYQIERQPHARDTVDHAVAIGKLMDAFAQAQIDGNWPTDMSALYGGSRTREHLSGGILARPIGDEANNLVGTLAPQPLVHDRGDIRLLDDAIGTGFRLLSAAPLDLHASQRVAFAALGGLICELPADRRASPQLDAMLGQYEAVLVRPDHYVFGVSTPQRSPEALLSELLAHFLEPIHGA